MSQELTQAIQEGNAPLLEAVNKLTTAIMAGAINGAALEERIIPMWAKDECDGECDLTGESIPSAYLASAQIEGQVWHVHPGVLDYAKAFPGKALASDTTIPDRFLGVPTESKLVPVAGKPARKKGERLPWTVEDLPTMTRPALMAAAKDVGLNKVCRQLNVDYRRETKDWMADAIARLKQGKDLPSVESEKNKQEMTGKSAASKKKRSKKGAKATKARGKAKRKSKRVSKKAGKKTSKNKLSRKKPGKTGKRRPPRKPKKTTNKRKRR